MDVFKLAFETTIVGLLAFVWLGIAIDLAAPNLAARNLFAEVIPKFLGENDKLLGVGLLVLAYIVGSAIVPISSQLLNDEHWPLPEDAIRCQVSRDQEERLGKIAKLGFPENVPNLNNSIVGKCSFWDRFVTVEPSTGERTLTLRQIWTGLKTPATVEEIEMKKEILTVFQLQESAVMNQGADKAERFRQLHERIVVLRGAVFSGAALFLICFFGCIAPIEGHPSPRKRKLWGLLLTAVSLGFCIYNAVEDLKHPSIFDVPVMEGMMGALVLFGGSLVVRGVRARPYLKGKFVTVVGLFFLFAYGGWIWSEVIYDQQVISSYAVLDSAAKR